ncbi:MAG TPA: CRISPR-associated helicase Cas3' [Candidatus Acidoferrum sp.]|nr:CRISPR-associated helicase Cas3' [Candidatus Acidoferrum sp.]
MRQLIAHKFPDSEPDPLEKHLKETGVRAAAIVTNLPLELSISRDDLVTAAYITGICHDFGKAKNQFQEYIWTGRVTEDKRHSAISSIFTFIVAKEIFSKHDGLARWLPFVCSYAVNRHHGSLVDLDQAYASESLEREYGIAKDTIDERLWQFQFDVPNYGRLDFSKFQSPYQSLLVNKIASKFESFRREIRDEAEKANAENGQLVDLYLALLTIISTLTESDIATVLGAPSVEDCAPIPVQKIDEFVSRLELNGSALFRDLRLTAWKFVRSFKQTKQQKILRLTLPTGLGKTLMGLHTASRMQRRGSPLIYSLPYLSIIDQVGEVTKSVLCCQPDPLRVMQFHSLTFPQIQDRDETPNFEQARFAMEDWDADLVVTTFDQLFYSFLSSQRSFIRRFYRLPGSTVILDEVQTIPTRILPLIETFFHRMSDNINLNVLYMTATKPRFLRQSQKVIPEEEHFFAKLDRTKLILQPKAVPFEKYLESVPAFLRKRKNQTTMFTANTVRCSLRLLDFLRNLKNTEATFSGMEIFYISGAIVPIERINRIRRIKEITKSNNKNFVVIVSTQCVEAGVDIDADEIIRDFAPWDSLMQICGRANRYGTKPCAAVWVHRWTDDHSRRRATFAEYIYDKVLLDATFEVLKGHSELDESQYFESQNRYIKEIGDRISDEPSRRIISAALEWKFSEINEFRKLFREGDDSKKSIFCVADTVAKGLRDIAATLWVDKDTTNAISQLERLIESEDFKNLADFVKVDPTSLKRILAVAKSKDNRTRSFELRSILAPMLQAYTVSVTDKTLEGLNVNTLSDLFQYIEKSDYESLARLR